MKLNTVLAETTKSLDSLQSTIVNKKNFVSPFKNYDAFVKFMKSSPTAIPQWTDSSLRKAFPQPIYESCTNPQQIDFKEIMYKSPNGYTRGWTIRPHKTDHALPVVIFNRGGFAKWGRIYPYELLFLCQVATKGYMVIASDFRSKPGTNLIGKQDKTDIGYGDVNDNFYLLEAINKDYLDIDINNLAVWGFSRGTTLAALMATRTNKIQLIIMQGLVADLVNDTRRSEFDEHVYPLLIEEYSQLSKTKQNAILNGISPKQLINKIQGNPNFLILHGAKDQRTSASDSLVYASKLLQQGFNVEYHLYPESGHVLTGSFDTYISEVINALKINLPSRQLD